MLTGTDGPDSSAPPRHPLPACNVGVCACSFVQLLSSIAAPLHVIPFVSCFDEVSSRLPMIFVVTQCLEVLE